MLHYGLGFPDLQFHSEVGCRTGRNSRCHWHYNDTMPSLQLRILLVHVQSHVAFILGRGKLWTVIKVFHTLISIFFSHHQGNPWWLGWLSEHGSDLTEPPPPHLKRITTCASLILWSCLRLLLQHPKASGCPASFMSLMRRMCFLRYSTPVWKRPLATFSRPLFSFIRSFSCGGLGWCLC